MKTEQAWVRRHDNLLDVPATAKIRGRLDRDRPAIIETRQNDLRVRPAASESLVPLPQFGFSELVDSRAGSLEVVGAQQGDRTNPFGIEQRAQLLHVPF